MPGFHKISAHRIACLALYKAFLSHCKHLPFSKNVKKQAQLSIRKKFRKDRRIQGLENIRTALKSAYENEVLFRGAATGDPTLTALLTEKLKAYKKLKEEQTAMSRAPSRPPPTFPPPLPPTTRLKRIKYLTATSDPLARARRIKGIRIHLRRLPTFGNTSHFPFFRRPGRRQSIRMTMTIKKKIKKRQQRLDLSETLEEWVQIAREEDEFDKMTGIYERGPGWVVEARKALGSVNERLKRMEERGLELVARFQEIIAEEKVEKIEKIRLYKRKKRRRLRNERRENVKGGEGGKKTKVYTRKERRRLRQKRWEKKMKRKESQAQTRTKPKA